MSDPFHTRVDRPYGPVHTGSGNLISISDPSALLVDSRGRTPLRVAEDELAWLHARFVHPPGFGEARERLEDTGTVLLDGEPGSGRNAAARMLLRELGGPGRFHEVLPDLDKSPRLNPAHIGDGDKLLLDLSTTDEQVWHEIQGELSSFRSEVRAQRAHLVVVLPHHQGNQSRTKFQQFLVETARPQEMRLLRAYLRHDGITEVARPPARLTEYLAGRPPIREIAALAALIQRARNAARGAGGFPEWCAAALTAVTARDEDVTQLVTTLREGPQRALLLTTAMLHGAHADAVHQATASLLKAARYPEDTSPLLERADLAERFKEIGAETDAGARVRFTELGYDTAIRAHFWNHLPELRGPLRAWVADTVLLPRLDQDDRDDLARRFAEECLRTGHTDELLSLVAQWATAPRGDPRLRSAAHALERGLHDQAHGRAFRRKIYDWSKQTLSTGLADVLVGVCAEVMAVRHPDEAMVRLHHLARRQVRGTTAREALLQLVRADHRLHRLMLFRLAHGLAEHDWSADAELFLALTEPGPLLDPGARVRPLLAETGVRSQLVTGWGAVFRRRAHQDWAEPVRGWLVAAWEHERHRDALLDVLVEGGGGRGDVLGRLYVLARDWAHAPPEGPDRRTPLVDLLFDKINTAQAIRNGEIAP
ncbi:hypothetical protein ACFZCY_29785 [Streptomyces sp. NPDC007983]|uniref:hypothetical protein n=1 Tax=Streptomyces sp. NPDC007983 TaxID=3364800 RepID=UPI0036E52F26